MATSPRRGPGAALTVVGEGLLVAVLYVATAQLAFTAAVVEGSACPVWPPTAVALVAVLLRGRRVLPGVALGVLVANATRPIPATAVALVVLVNTLEPVVTVALLRRLRVDTSLVTTRDVVAFVLAGTAGAALSALGGVGGLWLAGSVHSDTFAQVAALWAIGNVAGLACIAPLALVPRTGGHARRTETVAVLVLAATVGTLVLGRHEGETYAVLPLLIWAGLRLGPASAALVPFLLALLTVTFTARGDSPFVADTVTESLLAAQGFVLVTTLMTLLLAAVTEDRRRAVTRLAATEAENRGMLDEQAALRRVATAVAEQADVDEVVALVAREIAAFPGVEVGGVLHQTDTGHAEVVATSGADVPPGTSLTVVPGGPIDRARTTGRPQRFGSADAATDPTHPLLRRRVVAPVVVGDGPWGMLVAASTCADAVPAGVEGRLARLADLVGVALGNAEQRERLAREARTDPLTGLLNHRAFHERLREETARARRHGRSLSVAVFDIDRFKSVNDALGHRVGDEVLVLAARGLARATRGDGPAGRIGGDEIAVLLPEVGGLDAFTAADRLRRALSEGAHPVAGPVTASAGVCSLEDAGDADELLRFADVALYWAKAHGRDACFRYTPQAVAELDDAERRERLARAQALSGVRALARAIDAKDPSTTEHSERVADLAGRIAALRGWSGHATERLREAALVHDVGKIGIPDVVLFKPGRLTRRERTEVERHVELGAAIAREVLDDEQVDWILAHHEHADGGGYPQGLDVLAIPEGAQILAVADAWDAMTRARPYSRPMPFAAAREEILRLSGRQFAPAAVEALVELLARGVVEEPADAVTR